MLKIRGDSRSPAIAIVGMGAWYPGARDARQLWENVLARRRQFRRFPDQRLPLSEYYDPAPRAPDKTYATRGGFIDGFEFDWVGRRVPKKTVDVTDVSHWLALEVALTALADSGYEKDTLPRERTAVLVGNTMTGEQARTSIMRLRWPYVARSLRAAAEARGLAGEVVAELEGTMEQYYKSVFPAVNEDTLAGALSNTIAGRICNFLDLQGGGYTVDGACASGMIAVATAAAGLHHGELDFALAGGVDVSLDAMELIGFAKVGALTRDDMKVYDRRGSGFIPGEGAGFVALKRLQDARRDGDYVYAVIRGWGISSDGAGGITAPRADSQAIMLRRAYERAGFSPHELLFVEGHGTATVAGDKAELEAIQLALDADGEVPARSCGMTSFKSLIGHTKAASGLGGLIKAVIAANRRVVPPTAGCTDPNKVFGRPARALYPVLQGEIRDPGETMRVGASAMGFGGINCHIALESGDAPAAALEPAGDERTLMASNQDTELFVLAGRSVPDLIEATGALQRRAFGMSLAELTDLAAELAGRVAAGAGVRAAIVASSPDELLERTGALLKLLRDTPPPEGQVVSDARNGIAAGNGARAARVAFLFPGQGSQQLCMARVLRERFAWARDLVERADGWLRDSGSQPVGELVFCPLDRVADRAEREEWVSALGQTETAQPAICLASLLWLRYLERLGVRPTAVAGHSLGELTAFCAAGAFDEEALIRLAGLRGRAMAAEGDAAGTMASLACPRETAETLVASVGGYVVVANVNSPRQTVISGERASVEAVVRLAEAEDIKAVQLAVSNAFHSELVSDAAAQLRERAPIAGALAELEVAIFSSTTGERVDPGLDLREHFASQVTTRVDFVSLIERLSAECDLLLEVGPGRVLTGLTRAIVDEAGPPCLPVASEPGADRDLNAALGELFVRGAEIAWSELYAGRLVRPFTPASELLFIENQLERPFGAFGPVEPAAADLGAAGDGQPAPALAAAAGLTGTEMSDYLQRRGRFLADVIRADLGTPALEHGQRAAVEPEEAAEPVPAAAPASAAAIEARLIALVAEQTGFPADGIAGDARLLDDLNLDSIKAAELVTAAAQEHRVELPDPSEFANATLNEVAQALAAAASAGAAGQSAAAPHGPAGVDALAGRPSWVRNFVIEHVERPLPPAEPATLAGANVVILSEPRDLDVAEAIAAACRARGGAVRTAAFAEADVVDSGLFSHIVAVLPRAADPEAPPATAVQRALGRLRGVAAPAAQPRHGRGQTTLVYLQSGGGLGDPARPADAIEQCCAAAFAASVHHERPDLKVRVIDTAPALDARALGECVVAEIATPEPFVLAGYDAELTRRVPSPRPIEAADLAPRAIAWSPDDVVLVTGGAKGITAECALGLARSTGARMALAGSSPGPGERDTDGAVGRTLERFASAGLTARYYRCDVTDPAAVQNLVERVRGELGPVTGVVHGAGSNTPKRVEQASVEQARREVAPKVLGILNLCAALEGAPPKLIVGLSSITAVTGMPGNAWYGFANEALELTVRQFAARHPETAAQSIAFSVWDEVGMGARLGVVQTLADMGVAPIPADEGVRRFLELIHHDAGAGRVVVAARLRGLDTWAPEAPELPAAARYLEDVIHLEPGVEVVARAELTLERDGYLRDHVYKGTHLLPTTFGLEAMAQAAAYVLGERTLGAVRIEDIRLERPIPVDPADGTRIEVRAEALERRAPDDPRRVRAAIGVESSGFATDHFSAVFVLDAVTDAPAADVESAPEPLSIDPRADLYGGLLFQGPRFQRLESIHRLDSEGCVFRAHQTDERLILGDPYFRDALLQAPQLMVPQSLCLPVAIDALELFGDPEGRSGSRVCVARRERDQDGYERSQVLALDDDGRVMERLTGYRTRILERREDHPTAAELADPGERDAKLLDDRLSELGECFGVEVPVASLVYLPGLHALSREERHRLELPVLERTAGTAVTWLESGKPVVADDGGGLDVSVAHDEQACLCVAGIAPQGCDIAPEVHRSSEEWAALLGGARVPVLEELVGMGGAEVHDRAGTRIWAAVEAVRKAVGGEGPIELALERRTGDGVLFRGGRPGTQLHVLTFPLGLSRGPERLVAVVIPAPGPTPDPAPRAPAAHLTREGGGPPVVFVHGSIVGAVTWAAQQPLAARWSNLVLERRGFGDSPPADREDFEVDARDIVEALGDGAHLVAHSYGAIGAVLAATARPELVRSLTLVEPVAHAIATDHPAVQRGLLDLIGLFTSGPREPREFLVEFLGLIGLPSELPEQLPRGMEHTTRLLMNSNPPFAARLRLDDLARHGLRTLVVSGGHSEVFDAICDRLEERLDAERAVIPGALHAVPATGEPFNERLERFLSASGTVKDR